MADAWKEFLHSQHQAQRLLKNNANFMENDEYLKKAEENWVSTFFKAKIGGKRVCFPCSTTVPSGTEIRVYISGFSFNKRVFLKSVNL